MDSIIIVRGIVGILSVVLSFYIARNYINIKYCELLKRVIRLPLLMIIFLLLTLWPVFTIPSDGENLWLEIPLWITFLSITIIFFVVEPHKSRIKIVKEKKLLSISFFTYFCIWLIALILVPIVLYFPEYSNKINEFLENHRIYIYIYVIFTYIIPTIFITMALLNRFYYDILYSPFIESILRMIIIWLFIAWIFGVLYNVGEVNQLSSTLKLSQKDPPGKEMLLKQDSVDHLYFSVTVLTGTIIGDILPRTNIGKILIVLESLVAYVLLATMVGIILFKLQQEVLNQNKIRPK